MPGSSSWMPYATQGVNGFDDDERITLKTDYRNCFLEMENFQCQTGCLYVSDLREARWWMRLG